MRDLKKLMALYDAHSTANDVQSTLVVVTAPGGAIAAILESLSKYKEHGVAFGHAYNNVHDALDLLVAAKASIDKQIKEITAAEKVEEAKKRDASTDT